MSKYETGLHKGEEIMIACADTSTWRDHGNNVFIEREFDADWKELDTFRVAERLRGNRHQIWVKGQKFEVALDLAERLVVGKDYIPRAQPKPLRPEIDLKVGEWIPSDIHLHALTDLQMKEYYEEDVINRFEITKEQAFGLCSNVPLLSNKNAIVVSITESDDLLILYRYDTQFFTGVLKRKK